MKALPSTRQTLSMMSHAQLEPCRTKKSAAPGGEKENSTAWQPIVKQGKSAFGSKMSFAQAPNSARGKQDFASRGMSRKGFATNTNSLQRLNTMKADSRPSSIDKKTRNERRSFACTQQTLFQGKQMIKTKSQIITQTQTTQRPSTGLKGLTR